MASESTVSGYTGSLWWRWSWRDLRAHWVAVITIALVIALGTGLYAGLGSTSKWRTLAYDRSFASLHLHDVRLSLTEGTFAPEGSLLAASQESSTSGASDVDHDRISNAAGGPVSGDDTGAHLDGIAFEAARERLVIATGVDTDGELLAGRLIGAEFRDDSLGPDLLWLGEGRLARPGTDHPEVVIETKFAEYYGIGVGDTIVIGDGIAISVSGIGMAPEEFWVRGPEGSLLGHIDLATLYTDLATAQALSGRPGEVNDLLVRFDPRVPISDDQRRSLAESLLERVTATTAISATTTTGDESYAARILYDDIETDQVIFNAISLLVLGAAALAAFNLISRIVDTQRHEIGIGMALGVSRWRLGVRPVLIGVQVGVIGTLVGIAIGIYIGSLMGDLLDQFTPLPVSPTPFQSSVYGRGALLGVIPPVVAALVAVRRAVLLEPVDALAIGHLGSGRTGTLGSWVNRVQLPGGSLAQMPVRNLLRAPRRTLFTAVGVGAAITALVGVTGLLDSFEHAVDRGVAEVTAGDPDRVTVTFDTFYADTDPTITALTGLAEAEAVSTGLRIGGEVWPIGIEPSVETDESFEVLIEVLDLDNPVWSPRLIDHNARPEDGIILAAKAASDLGVGVGDTINMRHLAVVDTGITLIVSEVEVAGIHPAPLRSLSYLDSGFAERFGLGGFVNSAQVLPADGVDRTALQRAVFDLAGVTSATPVARVGEIFDQTIEEFIGVLYIAAVAVMLLALLIAFNSSRIALEERRREHATMMAFGIPVRSVVRTVVIESVIIGVLATAIGILAGLASLSWMLHSLVAASFPEFAVDLSLSTSTVVAAVVIGVVAVALAPLLLIGRLRSMDLPSTLRVLE